MQEFAHTLRVFHTWHFHHDASFLALEHLDVGLDDAELVYTVGDDILGIGHCFLDFLPEDALHLAVVAVGFHLRELLCCENLRERVSGCVLTIMLDEDGDEVSLCLFFLSPGGLHGFCEGGVFLVTGEVLHQVGHGDFEDDVHAALEVKAEAHLCLKAVLVRIP